MTFLLPPGIKGFNVWKMRWLGLICRKFFDMIIESSKRLQSKIFKELVDISLIYCSIVNITLWKEEQKNENQIISTYASCISNLSRSSHLGFLLEKVFLRNSKNLQENTCARDSLETVPESLKRLWHSPQRDSGTGVFL